MPQPTFHTYWTKERVDAGLRRFHADHDDAPGSRRYDQVAAEANAGKRGPDRPYPDSPTVRKFYPTMHAAWSALGIEPAADCRAKGRRRKADAIALPERREVSPRDRTLERRVAALEADRDGLLTVVRLLVDGDAPELDERRGLVRAGIAIGAAARGAK